MRVDLPRVPALREAVLRDEPPLDPVRGVPRGVGGVPAFIGERGFGGCGGAEAEMRGVGGEVGHGINLLSLATELKVIRKRY